MLDVRPGKSGRFKSVEHLRARADAQRQGNKRYCGEPAILNRDSQTVFKITGDHDSIPRLDCLAMLYLG